MLPGPGTGDRSGGVRRHDPNYHAELPTPDLTFQDDFEGMCRASALPNCRALWTTNLLRRPFLEERWRLKIILDAFGEKAVLKLTP